MNGVLVDVLAHHFLATDTDVLIKDLQAAIAAGRAPALITVGHDGPFWVLKTKAVA